MKGKDDEYGREQKIYQSCARRNLSSYSDSIKTRRFLADVRVSFSFLFTKKV